jgi:hypothetical protein
LFLICWFDRAKVYRKRGVTYRMFKVFCMNFKEETANRKTLLLRA